MKNEDAVKRLFFGLEVLAPWPMRFPAGRLIKEDQRHLTLAFLGNIPFMPMQKYLSDVPPPLFPTGLVGQFNQVLFLPKDRPHVIAWHIHWLSKGHQLLHYQKSLVEWLQQNDYIIKNDRPFLSHVTIARSPFTKEEWTHDFVSLPCVAAHLHLYESLGDLTYQPIWSRSIPLPFEEIEHTADIAFLIRGENLQDLHLHAQTALSFRFPQLMNNFSKKQVSSLEELIMDLNHLIAEADAKQGCPFKAISLHGKVNSIGNNLIEWEMIVDV